jgi:hypothetical protein
MGDMLGEARRPRAPQLICGRYVDSRTLKLASALVLALVACSGPADREAFPSHLVVRGFLDDGWPEPSGGGRSGILFAISESRDSLCRNPVDTATTTIAGEFRLEVPRDRFAHRILCVQALPPLAVGYRVLPLPHAGRDSLRFYCRLHGASGWPECRILPWGADRVWPRSNTDSPRRRAT